MHEIWLITQEKQIHRRSLTVRPWKMMGLEDDPASFWGPAYFQGLLLLKFKGVMV